jgi:hypothetical protein
VCELALLCVVVKAGVKISLAFTGRGEEGGDSFWRGECTCLCRWALVCVVGIHDGDVRAGLDSGEVKILSNQKTALSRNNKDWSACFTCCVCACMCMYVSYLSVISWVKAMFQLVVSVSSLFK